MGTKPPGPKTAASWDNHLPFTAVRAEAGRMTKDHVHLTKHPTERAGCPRSSRGPPAPLQPIPHHPSPDRVPTQHQSHPPKTSSQAVLLLTAHLQHSRQDPVTSPPPRRPPHADPGHTPGSGPPRPGSLCLERSLPGWRVGGALPLGVSASCFMSRPAPTLSCDLPVWGATTASCLQLYKERVVGTF